MQLLAPDKVLIPERYLDVEEDAPLSPEEQREKQKKVERIKTLIAKSKYEAHCCLPHAHTHREQGPEHHLSGM